MKAVSLFSGIGGIELGLSRQGIDSILFCEIDPLARAVLGHGFPGAKLVEDVRELKKLPAADLVTAGFPCQDLSQAGKKQGISGGKSGLVTRLLALIEANSPRFRPEWILIENVPYMLRLDRGEAMRFLTQELERLGYQWAYRVVDARAFGLPQRRERVVLLASKTAEPAGVLFRDNLPPPDLDGKPSDACAAEAYGFYWTEGSRGVGWTREGVPPIKCGSTLGIASPPAVWQPKRDFVGQIDIRDAERLQGFPEGWTDYSRHGVTAKQSFRWRLVGNAVSTRVSEWVGGGLRSPGSIDVESRPLNVAKAWPLAAFSHASGPRQAMVSKWAAAVPQEQLSSFLRHDLKPLSGRATRGFLSRAKFCTNIVYSDQFIASLELHAAASSA